MAESKEPLSPKEKMNRYILYGCLAFGVIIGVALSLLERPGSATVDGPLPQTYAMFFAFIFGVILPIATWFWYRVIDEQEIDAYRAGAHVGMSLFAIATPVWWFLWRGGLLPPVDIVIVYYATIMTVGIVWIYKKYF